MIYLASPYSHPDAAVRLARFHAAVDATAVLLRRGEFVYSPIGATHPVFERHPDVGGDWEAWKRYDEHMIGLSERLVILTIDGWRESKGVAAEVSFAKSRGIPVRWWSGSQDETIEPFPPERLAT